MPYRFFQVTLTFTPNNPHEENKPTTVVKHLRVRTAQDLLKHHGVELQKGERASAKRIYTTPARWTLTYTSSSKETFEAATAAQSEAPAAPVPVRSTVRFTLQPTVAPLIPPTSRRNRSRAIFGVVRAAAL